MAIKNIIFDLGGVLLNINYQKTIDAFSTIGVKALYSQASQEPVFDLLEKGLITELEFCEEIRSIYHSNKPNSEIISAWNALLLDFPSDRIQMLKKLAPQYRIFLLSNTNIIHYKAYCKDLKKHHRLNNLSSLFEKEYYSHEIHMRKPDAEIFEFVLSDACLDRKETLFIDDSIQHIKGAKAIGINAQLMEVGRQDVFSILKQNSISL